ncbi:MAG: type I-PGING CRISPR-associated protein Cas8c/Csp2 [Mangrovibacterium sp.]
MIIQHPFLRYAKALVRVETKKDKITINDCLNILNGQKEYYRLAPTESYEGKEKVKFAYSCNECVVGKKTPYTKNYGIFLAPNVILEDGNANSTWDKIEAIDKEFETKKDKNVDALLSTTAVAGDYIRFSEQGGKGKVTPKISYEDYILLLISLITEKKPCLQYHLPNSNPKKEVRYNACIIPDLIDGDMDDFIRLFKRLMVTKTKDLFIGNVLPPGGTGQNKRTKYEARRPLIYKGNFPNPPRSSAMGSVALLGAIGELSKEAEVSELAQRVLDSLKEANIYMIKPGDATTFTYNYFVIDLAKAGKLKTIVDSIYYSELALHGKRSRKDLKPQEKNALVNEYQKFDLFTSRFLRLFNRAAFKDFLAFRAEYPKEVTILFKTYFNKVAEMEKIDSKVVSSARAMGKWLNQVAYFAAKAEIKGNSPNYKEELRKAKSKGLIEIESSIFCAKSGRALVGQTIARACRLIDTEAPNEATLFIDKTISGEIPLDDAKNILIAYSRLNPYEKKTDPLNENLIEEDMDEIEELDLSKE